MHDIETTTRDDIAQLENGRRAGSSPPGDAFDLQICAALEQRAAFGGRQRHVLTEFRETPHQEQHLSLPSAPRALRVGHENAQWTRAHDAIASAHSAAKRFAMGTGEKRSATCAAAASPSANRRVGSCASATIRSASASASPAGTSSTCRPGSKNSRMAALSALTTARALPMHWYTLLGTTRAALGVVPKMPRQIDARAMRAGSCDASIRGSTDTFSTPASRSRRVTASKVCPPP